MSYDHASNISLKIRVESTNQDQVHDMVAQLTKRFNNLVKEFKNQHGDIRVTFIIAGVNNSEDK